MATYTSNFLRLLSYTKQLTSYVNTGQHSRALSLFHHIHSSLSLTLDPFVFPLALKSCSALHCSQLGTSIHSHTLKTSLISNPFVACALITFYGKCLSISVARKLFDEISNRNIVVWNAIISIYTHSNNVKEALQLFENMDFAPNASTFNSIIAALPEIDDGSYDAIKYYRQMQMMGFKPDLITVLALLPACVGLAALNFIKEIHGYAIRNDIDPSPQLRSGFVEAYGRCGCLNYASRVFFSISDKDVVAWSCLISAYAFHGEARLALEMFREMEIANVKPDGIAFLGVLKACSHAGLADEAKVYFAQMRDVYGVEASSDHYSCLVDVLSRAGRLYEAYEVIKGMQVKVTAKAWGALLGACQTYGEVELAEIAGRALFEIEPDNPANYVLLARIYQSAGRYEEAQRIRRQMKERGVKIAPGSSWVIDQDSKQKLKMAS